jgi:hypothetical protein
MAKKKTNIMSLAIDESTQALLTQHAKANNISRSELIRNLVDKYIVEAKKHTIVEHEPDTIPIVFKVPVSLKGDAGALKQWLDLRVNAIVSKLGPAA